MELSEGDARLLGELQENCVQGLKTLSKKLGMPMSTVHDKIKKLEKEGIIRGYSAVLDHEKLGKKATAFVLATVKYSKTGAKVFSQRELARRIAAFPLVQEVYIIAGEWDLLIKLKGRDTREIGSFVIDELRSLKNIDRTLTISSFITIKESCSIPLP